MTKSSIDKLLEEYISVSENTYYTIIDGRTIILIPEENSFYTLNPVGTRIWELADGSLRVKEIVNAICEEFEVDKDIAISDVIRFIEDLSKMHLLCLSKEKR